MIGQKKIIGMFENWVVLNQVPRFLILQGGHFDDRKHLAKKLIEISEAKYWISNDLKIADVRLIQEDILTLSEPTFYLICARNGLNSATQNALLKVLEEPPTNSYFIISVDSTSSLLSTIQSRAYLVTMENYTRTERLQATHDTTLVSIYDTIGQIKNMTDDNGVRNDKFEKLYDVAEKIYENLDLINEANLFKATSHINIDDAEELLTILLFLAGTDKQWRMIELITRCKKELNIKGINRERLLKLCLVKMKGAIQ